MKESKKELIEAITNLQKAIITVENLAYKKFDMDTKQQDAFDDMFNKTYPFPHCISEVRADINVWRQTVIEHKIVESEVVVCEDWDRIWHVQRTDGKITGLNVMHGSHDMECFMDSKVGYNWPDAKMLKYYNMVNDFSMFAEEKDEMQRLNKIVTLYFMTVCEYIPWLVKEDKLKDITS